MAARKANPTLKVLSNALTGSDNKTFELCRILLLASTLVVVGLEIYSVIWKAPFDVQSFCIGIGGLLTGGGIGIRMNSNNNPPNS